MTKYKVGDRVKGITADIDGCEGIILKDTGMGYDIRITKIGRQQKHSAYSDEWYIGAVIKRNTYWVDCIKLITSKSKSPRQFVLLKDTPEIQKGDFVYLNKTGLAYGNTDRQCEFYKTIVETQPDWFQEVFEEEPKETIKIGKVVYDKKEFEDAVKNLKPIK